MAQLRRIVANPATPEIAADAWLALGSIHHRAGDREQAIEAFESAVRIAPPESASAAAAAASLEVLRRSASALVPAIRILPPERQVVSGRTTIRTSVTSASVARVAFTLDGDEVATVTRPPFTAGIDFGTPPRRRVLAVLALDARGDEIGHSELIVNDSGESFWLRFVEPVQGAASGSVRVRLHLRAPDSRRLERVAISWNDAERAVLLREPWEAVVQIHEGQVGVLRAVAELDDGRTSEDAVLLNATGYVEQSDVTLVELPMTLLGDEPVKRITPERIVVREGRKVRKVESIATADETPLTVGLLIDSSASMQKTLPDVQEAALRFLETMLGERDRAFVIAFDTNARLIQPPTGDIELLRRSILGIRPEGLTALHDAIAIGLLQFEAIRGRRALIVLTDGVDRTSRYTGNDVTDLARRSSVPIHLIVAPPELPATIDVAALPNQGMLPPPRVASRGGTDWQRRFAELRRAAASTGGSAHLLDHLRDLSQVYADIADGLRAQILAFIRADAGRRENEWREVKVQVEPGDLSVHAPAGYYAPW